MSLIIDLTPEEEARLRAAAANQGVEPAEVARRVLVEHLPALSHGASTLELFAAWDAEDATDDPAELAARNREWEDLKSSLNANRAATGEGPLFP